MAEQQVESHNNPQESDVPPTSSEYHKMSEKVSSYLHQLKDVRGFTDWTKLNEDVFGSTWLEMDKFTFGTLAGLVSGYAAKQALKTLAVLLGVGFIVLQSLNYAGYLKIEWHKIEQEVAKKFDTDEDGKLTTKDFAAFWEKFQKAMSYTLPGAGGFGFGFLLAVFKW
ncbi:unnamed protein product [Vitrella brassicaformis CCMP3155]|uniref:EF-hand domain-containing protein n=2 Tax=Vitrella brassicaformis TaxID=1169539 RepID=A0A0G4EHV7_VITBC|nr:unnamed protein product [Vitrella brassicaformis CCMP3155]|eukprot:CEL95785.1 unnamed protein product [Vitrella brassicaformis CCMP3155]